MPAGIAIIAAALLALAYAWWTKSRAKAQFSWLQVPGTVTRSGITLGRGFDPEVGYEYVHEGRVIRGDRLRTSEISVFWPGPARRATEKYPVGARVTVFVDPTDPSKAVLEPGGDTKFMPFWCFMAAFLLFTGTRLVLAANPH